MTRRDLSDVPHTVYRYYDERGRALYIGCTSNLEQRDKNHRSTKDWYPKVARLETVLYPTRAEGREAEKRATRAERPLYNLQNVTEVINRQNGSEMSRIGARRVRAQVTKALARLAATP